MKNENDQSEIVKSILEDIILSRVFKFIDEKR